MTDKKTKNTTWRRMLKRIKHLFCFKHDYLWMRNLYGDEIIVYGYKRSMWRCRKCGKIQYRKDLVPVEPNCTTK